MRDNDDNMALLPHEPKAGSSQQPVEALLPCPFCGGDAVLLEDDVSEYPTDGKVYHVTCLDSCLVAPGVYGQTSKDDAIKKWNTRSGKPQRELLCDQHQSEYKVFHVGGCLKCWQENESRSRPVSAAPADENWIAIGDARPDEREEVLLYRPSDLYCKFWVGRINGNPAVDYAWITAKGEMPLGEFTHWKRLRDPAATTSSPAARPEHYFVPTETPDKCGVEGCESNVLAHPETPKHQNTK